MSETIPESPVREKLPDMSGIGLFLGILFCSLAIYQEMSFRHTVAILPPGTSIRPMEHALGAVALAFGGLLLGVPCSLLGAMVARVERKRISLWLGMIGVALSLLPFPIAWQMSNETMRTAHVQIAP